MGQTVKLRRSAISGKIPINSQLQLGELSMNTTDGKIFLSKSGSSGPSVEEVIITNTQNFGNIDLVGDLTATNISSSFIGDGSGLYNIPAAGVTGLSLDRIANSTSTASIDADGLHINTDTTVTGSLTATEFTGSGLGLTNVPIKISGSDAGSTSIDSTFTRIKFDDSTGIKISGTTGGDAVVYLSGVASESDGGEGKTEKLEVTSATSTWTLNHNLNEKHPSIEVFDSNDEVIIPQKIEATSVNQVVVSFASPQTGTVTATVGGGLPTIDSGYENRVLSVGNDGIATWKTGILSGSIDFSTLVDTGSFNTYTSSNNNTNSDQNGRLDSLEGFTSSIDDTYATDSDVTTLRTDLNTYSSSTDGRLDSLEVTSGSHDGRLDSIESKTGSFLVSNDLSTIEGKIGSLETTSGSHDDRIDRIETSTSSLNSFTSSINTTIKGKLNNDGVISGSIQIDHDATTNYVGNEHIDHSSITIGSGKGLTGGGTIDTNRSLTLDTGSVHFLSGIKSKLNTETVVSGSEQINITETTNYNLVDGRLDSIESFTSSIDDTYATDADVTTLRGDLNTYTSSNDTLNSTQDGRLDSLESNSGSYLTEYNDEYTTGATFGTSNGIVTFTRNDGDQYTVDLDGRYLTSFTETDPIFTAHAVYDITSTQIGNWDTAYGWGDHSQEGYLTTYNNEYTTGATFNGSNGIITFTRNDGDTYTLNISSTLTDINVTGGTYNDSTQTLRLNKSNGTSIDVTGFAVDTVLHTTGATFNSSDGVVTFTKNGGDTYTVDLDGRYLTSFTETDPIFTASPSAGITETNITNWDSAYTYSTVGHLPLSGGTITGDVRFLDSDQLKLGTDNDLRLWHNGTNSYVFNYNGDLNVGSRYGDLKFLGSDGSTGEVTYFFLDGSQQNVNFQKDAIFTDSKKVLFGGSGDLQMYHDGTNSYIKDNGTGVLNIQGSTVLNIGGTNGEVGIQYTENAGVTLRHNNVVKFTTDSTGVSVTGIINATGGNSSQWNTAYGWGDHGSAGYLTSYNDEYTTGATFNTSNGVITFTRNDGDTFNVDIDNRYLPLNGGTISGTLTISSASDGHLILKQTDAGSVSGTPEGGWNYMQFYDAQNDRQGYFGIDSSGNFLFNPEVSGAEVRMSRTLRVSSNIISTGTITASGYNDSNWNTAYGWGDHSQEGYLTSYNDEYTTGATFNGGNGIVTFTRNDGDTYTVDLSATLSEITITGGTYNDSTQTLTLTKSDGNTVDVSGFAIESDVNYYLTGATFNTTNGVITYKVKGSSDVTVDIDGRYLTSYSETDTLDSVTDRGNTTTNNITVGKLTSTWGEFTTTDATNPGADDLNVSGYGIQGNRTSNPIYLHNYGNGGIRLGVNTTLGDGTNGVLITDTTSTFYTNVSVTGTLSASGYNDSNWNTAYGWGDHSQEGYLTSYNDEYTTGATFNGGNGIITFTRNDGDQYTVDISSTLTDINVTGGTYNDANQTLTLNKSNGSSVDVTGFAVDTVLHTTGATFNTGNGVITFTKNGGATYTVDIDGKYAESGHNHDSAYVNVDGDTMTGTLDVHVPDAGIILSSGNSSATGTPDQFFIKHVNGGVAIGNLRGDINFTSGNLKNDGNLIWDAGDFTSTNISNWDTAYGWGDHSQAGYVTSSGNTVIGTDSDINTSGSYVVDQLTMTDGVITSHSTRQLSELKIPDTRAAEKTPNEYTDQHLSLDFTDEFGSLGSWYSGITLKGWTGTYAAWQLISEADSGIGDTNLYFRQGNNTTWQSMRTVWTSANFANNSSNWNTAYGWGDHASAGYITGYSEVDTLATVTSRGSSTTNDISVGDFFATHQSADDATTKAEMLSYAVAKFRPHSTNSGTLAIAQVDGGNSVGLQFTNGAGSANWDMSLQPFGGNVGINKINPSGALHVYSGTSERFLISGDVHVQGSTDLNINGTSRRLSFNSGTGTIRTTTANNLILQTDSTTALTIDVNQNTSFAGDITILEDLYATNQNLKFHAGGTHVMNIDVNGKVYPATHNAYDLGHSASLAWRNLYLSGTVTASGGNSSQWNTAYGWGDHSQAGYITGYSETDTLQSVTDRGATTTNDITISNESTPKLVLKDTTNNLQGQVRVANSYMYLNIDSPNTVASTRLVFQTDGVTAMYLDQNQKATFEDDVNVNGNVDMGTNIITDTKVGQWDTAYGWGDHSVEGYLTSESYTAHEDTSTLNGNYGGGNNGVVVEDITVDSNGHVTAVGTRDLDGRFMLQGQTLSNPDTIENGGNRYDPNSNNPTNEHYAILTYGNGGNVTGQLATHFQTGDLYSRGHNNSWSTWKKYFNTDDFTTTNVSNWNTAYGWGDHSLAGYTGDQDLSGYATETYVGTQIDNLIASAPGTLDTLNELAAALGDDPNFATTITTSIATKLPLSGGTLTGDLTVGSTARASDTVIKALSDDSHKSGFEAYGSGQGNGYLYVGQSTTHGGGISYNGDSSPAYVGGETSDYITFYRRAAGTNTEVFAFPYSSNNVYFNGEVHSGGGNSAQWNTAVGWGDHSLAGYLTSYSETDTLSTVTARGRRTHSNGSDVWNATTPGLGEGNIHLMSVNTDHAGGAITFNASDANSAQAGIYVKSDGSYGTKMYIATTDSYATGSKTAISIDHNGLVNITRGDNRLQVNGNRVHHAGDFTTTDVANGVTAYGWGDHSVEGYLTSSSTQSKYLRTDVSDTIESGSIISFKTAAGNARGYLQSTDTNDEHFIIATSGGEDIAFKDGGVGGTTNMIIRGDGNVIVTGIVTASGGNSGNWNEAYGWGNHAGAGYITSPDGGNATTLDGVDSTQFLRSDTADSFTGTITMGTQKALVANNYGRGVYGLYSSTKYQHVWSMGTSYNLSDDGSTSGNLYGLAFTHTNVGGQSKSGLDHQLLVMRNGTTVSAIGAGMWTNGTITTTSHGTSADWKTAYGWGDHASGGYASSSHTHAASDITSGTFAAARFATSTRYNIGLITGYSSQTRDKLRVWDSGTYSIGMKSGYDYGHIGSGEYAMSFQMSNTDGRGWWWGDDAHTDDQGAASLTTQGKMVIAKSLSVGQGETITNPSDTPLYVEGTTAGETVFEVQGTSGQLFSITDSLIGDIFEVSDISGIPILTVNSSGVVTVDDTLRVTGDVIAYYASDKRLKDNIKPIENAIDKIKMIGGYEFDWNSNSRNNNGHDVGVIAQEIEEVLPELVGTRGDGYKGVKYEKLTALLIQSNKELIARVEELESKLKK